MQPPSFPIEPLVTNKTVEICRESWGQVKLQVRRLHPDSHSLSLEMRAHRHSVIVCVQERKGVSGVVYFYGKLGQPRAA